MASQTLPPDPTPHDPTPPDPARAARIRPDPVKADRTRPDRTRLEQRVLSELPWIEATPGACNAGRFLGCDDPDRLSWDVVRRTLAADGILGFRLLRRDVAARAATTLSKLGYRLDTWDVYRAEGTAIRHAIAPILSPSLPDGLQLMPEAAREDPATLSAAMRCMERGGLVPFPAEMMAGRAGGPSVLIMVGDRTGQVVATAYAYFAHNAYSPHRNTAWGGLVAVDAGHRGRGLGALVNACMAGAAVTRLGADALYELVADTNLPSRRMVERCGLTLDPDLLSGIATTGPDRYTR